ncbi:MAG: site-specific integrase [Methylococcaceae bacterium]|jgi:integrase/recombinase XerD
MITKKKPGRPAGTTGKARAITDKELNIVLAVTEQGFHAQRNVAVLILSHYLGLRAKELSCLLVGDVFDGKEIVTTLRLVAAYTKGNAHRDISLENKRVVKALEDYIIYRKEVDGKQFSLKAALFRSGQNKHFSPNSMARLFIDLYHKAGIDHASSHSGRRSLITKLSEGGVDIFSISKIAGHKSIFTTQAYIAENPNRLRNILMGL